MKYFDLHCDTLTEIEKRKETLYTNCLEVSAEKAGFENYIQTFAVFLNEDLLDGRAYFEEVIRYAENCGGLFPESQTGASSAFTLARGRDELISLSNTCLNTGMLSVENAGILIKDVSDVCYLKSNHVKAMSLTWNAANLLGGGSERQDAGLTALGEAVTREALYQGIILDVSHLSDLAFYDMFTESPAPHIATHSNCRSVCGHMRNLTDSQLTEIFRRGGLAGINFYPLFLGDGDVYDLIYRHIQTMLELGGEHCVCIGADFDGADMDQKLSGVDMVPDLYYYLESKLGSYVTDNIFYSNAMNYFKKHLTF